MPNGHDREWVRLCGAVDGFYARYGRWPTELQIPSALLQDLKELFAPEDFAVFRQKVSLVRLFVTTFPCHYCARHIVAAGIDEVQYIELYPKSKATKLHRDSITVESLGWRPPSEGGSKVLFRPFYGVAPRFYERAFFKDRELKEKQTGVMRILDPEWASPWYLSKTSYVQIEAKLLKAASPHHASVDENARADSPPASPASDG